MPEEQKPAEEKLATLGDPKGIWDLAESKVIYAAKVGKPHLKICQSFFKNDAKKVRALAYYLAGWACCEIAKTAWFCSSWRERAIDHFDHALELYPQWVRALGAKAQRIRDWRSATQAIGLYEDACRLIRIETRTAKLSNDDVHYARVCYGEAIRLKGNEAAGPCPYEELGGAIGVATEINQWTDEALGLFADHQGDIKIALFCEQLREGRAARMAWINRAKESRAAFLMRYSR